MFLKWLVTKLLFFIWPCRNNVLRYWILCWLLVWLYVFSFVADCATGANLHGLAGFIASPNFPNNYPQYSRCAWNITVPRGYFIKLTFLHFHLEPYQYSPCYYSDPGARVTITNVATNNNYHPFMLCGQSLPHPVYSVGNSIQVIFTSLSKQYSGFKATYRAMTNESGKNDVNLFGHAN